MTKFSNIKSCGFNVIPLQYGDKKPIKGFNWKRFQSNLVTEDQCKEWDGGHYNVAIITGQISKCFVVDVDGEEGEVTLKRLIEEYGDLPKTVEVKTGRGRHLYFRYPEHGNIKNLAGMSSHGEILSGLDVRGNGGYVVAPPSQHPNGDMYEWVYSPDEIPIADAPDWLLSLYIKPEPVSHEAASERQTHSNSKDLIQKECELLEETPEGGRNGQLNKSAFMLGKLIPHQLSESEVVAALKTSALKVGLEDRETRATIKSGIEAGKKAFALLNERWNDPDMRIIHRSKPTLPECPHNLLGEELCRFVNDASACKCAPPDYIMAALLCAAAGIIGNARQVLIWEGWTEATALWFMLVGLPSCNKSPALDAIFPIIRQFEAKYQQEYALEMREYKHAIEQQKADKNLDTDAVEPKKPTVKRIIVHDATVEKLALILAENPKGLICSRDELAGLLANLERNGGNDRPFYLESFGGRATSVDRVKYNDPIFVPSVLLSLIGSIQPDKLDQLMLKQPDDGLASRFLYVSGTALKIKEPEVTPDYEMLQKTFDALESLHVPLDENGVPKPKQIPLCAKGRSLIEALGNRLQGYEQREHGMIISHLGKLRGIAARIALVLQYLDWTMHLGDEPTQVEAHHVEGAIAMVEQYFYPMGKYCLSNVSGPQDEQDAQAVARWLVEHKKTTFTAREALRDVITSRDTKRRDAALDYLEESGWVRRVQTHNKSVIYDVNPHVIKV